MKGATIMKNYEDKRLLERQQRIDADRRAQARLRKEHAARQRRQETAAAMAQIARTGRVS